MSLLDAPVRLNNLIPRRRIASQHGGWLVQGTTRSNGTTQTSGTDRLLWNPNTDVIGLEFVFANGYADSSGIMNPTGNMLPFYCALENNGNQLAPVSFGQNASTPISTGGKTGVNLGDGCIAHSLPVHSGVFTSGSNQWYRVYKAVSAGQKWPLNFSNQNNSWLGINTTDQVYGSSVVDGSDQTASFGAQAWGPFKGGTVLAFAATAIIAEQVTPVPVVMVTGDSISAGTADVLGRGYLGRALGDASVAFHNDGLAGVSLNNLTKYGQVPQRLARFVDHAVIHAMTNDLNSGTPATLSAAQALYVNACKAFGCKTNRLWFCTTLPRTTSSDSWATPGNQTPPAYENLRVQINNWLRDSTSSGAVAYLNAQVPNFRVAGVIDACPAIEKNSDGSALVLDGNGQQTTGTGGRWITSGAANGYTSDGIHPNTSATALMTAYVPVSRFTIP